MEAEVVRKMCVQEEMKRELESQMQRKEEENVREVRERRRMEKTSFGPEEDQRLHEMHVARKMEAKQMTKAGLEELIRER
jgi:hypothetical protein